MLTPFAKLPKISLRTDILPNSVAVFITGIMLIVGLCQYNKKDEPVGFYNTIEPPKTEEIVDIIQWNNKHGMIWIAYGI